MTTRIPDKKDDKHKLATFREIWDAFVANCKKVFISHNTVTVDRQLVAFCGKSPFKQYMSSKPAKYGIKIWASADVETTYIHNLQVYTTKRPSGQPEKNQSFCVVCDLVSSIFSTGLAKFLLLKNMTLLETVRKNKPDTPKELNVTKRKKV